jgi:hypothetical protein
VRVEFDLAEAQLVKQVSALRLTLSPLSATAHVAAKSRDRVQARGVHPHCGEQL